MTQPTDPLSITDCDLILTSLRFTSERFETYPGYPSEDCRRDRLAEVDRAAEGVRMIRRSLKASAWAALQLEANLLTGTAQWLAAEERKARPHSQGGMLSSTTDGTVQERIDYPDMRWEQLEAAIRWRAATEKKHAAERKIMERLLTLRDKAPEAATPKEAAEQLKLDLDEYLAGAA